MPEGTVKIAAIDKIAFVSFVLACVFGMPRFSGESVFVVAFASILAVHTLRKVSPQEAPRAYLKKGASCGSLVGAALGLVLIVGERLNGPSYGLYFVVLWTTLLGAALGGFWGAMVVGAAKVARAVAARTTSSSQNTDEGSAGRQEGPPSKSEG